MSHRLGARRIANQARAELIAAGARPRRDAVTGRDALTAGELRVARLAAEGLSNREIAQALFITTRTAKVHLGRVTASSGSPAATNWRTRSAVLSRAGRGPPARAPRRFPSTLRTEEIEPPGSMRRACHAGRLADMNTQRVIPVAAGEGSTLRGAPTAPSSEGCEFDAGTSTRLPQRRGVPLVRLKAAMTTPWDAHTYDVSSGPQQTWASEVLARLAGIPQDATVLDVGCGTGRVTESLLALVPRGRVLAIDASEEMVALARARLGARADVWCQDVLALEVAEPVAVIVSTAALHWVTDHDRLWARLARALRPGGILEVQCGGAGNIAHVREVIETVARDTFPELVGWSPWVFASPQETEQRLREAGFGSIRCWLEERPTHPQDVGPFVRTSILAAHLARLPQQRREQFASAVVAGLRLPLDHVRLNVSALRKPA